jgi:hypothetical protein
VPSLGTQLENLQRMKSPLLAAVLIVKNEAASIEAVLASVDGVADHVTICDTGSTDSTQNIIQRVFAMSGRRDELHEEALLPYAGLPGRGLIDFAANRNRVLDLEEARHEPATYTLMLSGNEILHGGQELRDYLTANIDAPDDAYCVTMTTGGNTAWQYPRILRTGGGRRYIFPIHEVPVGKDGQSGGPLIPGVTVEHAEPDPARLLQRMREVDLPILEHMAEVELTEESSHEAHLARARALVNLGMTHRKLAMAYPKAPGSPRLSHEMAAMAYFYRRQELGGDPEEVHYALFQYFNLAEAIGIYNSEELMVRLEALSQVDPKRPEVRYMLAVAAFGVDPRKGAYHAQNAVRVAREAKQHPLKLPADTRVEWLALRLGAMCAKGLGKTKAARTLALQGVAAGGPESAFEEYLSEQAS